MCGLDSCGFTHSSMFRGALVRQVAQEMNKMSFAVRGHLGPLRVSSLFLPTRITCWASPPHFVAGCADGGVFLSDTGVAAPGGGASAGGTGVFLACLAHCHDSASNCSMQPHSLSLTWMCSLCCCRSSSSPCSTVCASRPTHLSASSSNCRHSLSLRNFIFALR